LAALRHDPLQRQQRAQWLIEHAADTAYELPALIVAARAAEQRLEQSPPAELAAARQAVYRIYRRLVARLGTSVTTLQNDQNARVALSRSADYAMQLEQYQDAADRWDLLLEAFPSDRNYLRNSGICHFRASQYPLSLARWRLLLAGVPGGTDLWYEAKYHQILCLVETEPETARKVLQQFQLLDPELGSPPWRSRFQTLLRNFLK
jgi:tetratricopeptide (TPR) repeat protein